MAQKTELILALDGMDPEISENLITKINDKDLIYKVGSELFLQAGPLWVQQLARERRVFLDLKFYDIPHQVRGAARQVRGLGVEMFTVHLSGGKKMIQAVREEIGSDCKLLGVSVLTSFSEGDWAEVAQCFTGGGAVAPIGDAVSGLCALGAKWGVDGIVCSPHEVSEIAGSFPAFYTVVPGIRPEGSARGDQQRVMTPAEAAAAGARAIVVGRPVTQAQNPVAVLGLIKSELGWVDE